MATLIVRNVDDSISKALKIRASQHGISAEAEHRRILEAALLQPRRRQLAEVLMEIPEAGRDEDFSRIQVEPSSGVFD